MATLSVVSTHQGKGVQVKLVSEDGRVLHNTHYRNVGEGLWHGLRWSFITTWEVDGVWVDGGEIKGAEAADRLWDYVDGRSDPGDPFFVCTTEEIIT